MTEDQERKSLYDLNIVTGLLAGGIGIMFYEIFQILYHNLFVESMPPKEFNEIILPKVFAGFLIAGIAFVYAVIVWWKRKNRKNYSVYS